MTGCAVTSSEGHFAAKTSGWLNGLSPSVTDPVEPMGIALGGDNVYFANGEGTVFEVSKNGGPTHVVLSSLGQFPAGLARRTVDRGAILCPGPSDF